MTSANKTAKLLLEAEPVEMPEEYRTYLEIRSFTGPTPKFVQGGYLDQPYQLVRLWEICKFGEKKAKELTAANPANKGS